MSFTVEQDAAARTVIVILNQDFNLQTESSQFRSQVREALDSQSQPIPLIFDTRTASISARDLLVATESESQDLLRHANIRETIVITNDVLVQMAAKGVNSFSFGFINVRTFKTLEEALAYVQETSGIH